MVVAPGAGLNGPWRGFSQRGGFIVMQRSIGHAALAVAIVTSASGAATAARAREVLVGADLLAGAVRDRSGNPDRNGFSGGALPSVQVRGDAWLLQGDGVVFSHAGEGQFGGGAHLGARLGEGGYLGVYGSAVSFHRGRTTSAGRIGAEARLARGPFTLAAIAGYERIGSAQMLVATTSTDRVYDRYGHDGRFFSIADLRYAPGDRFAVAAGHRYIGGRHAAALGAQVGLGRHVALVFEGRLGEGDYRGVLGGLRVRFGGGTVNNGLLENRLVEDLFAPGNSRSQLLDPLPPPDNGGGCGTCGGYCEQ